jgi:hypothetical protein
MENCCYLLAAAEKKRPEIVMAFDVCMVNNVRRYYFG